LQQFSALSLFFPVEKLHTLHAQQPFLFNSPHHSESRVVCQFDDQGTLSIFGYKEDVSKRMEQINIQM